MIEIDALGDICPIPLIKTKKALKDIGDNGVILVSVDNEISKENLEKMAKEMGFCFSSKKLKENIFEVEIIKGNKEKELTKGIKKTYIEKHDNIIVISSDKMGEGNEELGKILLKTFIYTVSEMEILPKTIIFYNAGVSLVSEDSPILEDLTKMYNEGVAIISCGACLNYYGLTEKLAIGEISNMYSIVDVMCKAGNIIKP